MGASILLQSLVLAPDPHLLDIGLRLTLIGMSTVFIGLVVLSFSLPLIKKLAEGKKKESLKVIATGDPNELSKDEVVAITTAIHAHFLRINQMEDMKLTWEMYERPYSPWRLAGRSRMLMDRTAARQMNRRR